MNTTSALGGPSLKDAVALFERTLIHSVLVACDWNQRKTAEALGVLPTTLSEKIHRLSIHPPGARPRRTRREASMSGNAPRPASMPAIEITPQVSTWCTSCQSTTEARRVGR